MHRNLNFLRNLTEEKVMEYLRGGSLRSLLDSATVVSDSKLIQIALDIAT